MRVFVTTDGGASFAGPMETEAVYANLQSGALPPNAGWLKATGQSFNALQAQVGDLQPLSALGEGFARMVESREREAPEVYPQVHTAQPLAESGPSLLRFLGWVWFVAGIVGGIYIWRTIGTIESSYGGLDRTNPVGIAWAIGLMSQGLLVLIFCLELAKISDRVRALWLQRRADVSRKTE